MKLKDHVIIVTGGASGIGLEACRNLAREGARVVVADYDLDGAEKVATELTAAGTPAFATRVDVSKAEQVEAAVEFAVDKFGTLNGIFNNAGIGLVKPFLEMDPATYHRVIDVDQHSVYYGMHYAAKKMVALGAHGAFVNTASIYGSMAALGSFNYNAAKAAVIMMTRSAALELAPHGIRVVSIAPTFVETPMTRPMFAKGDFGQWVRSRIPGGRIGGPDEVAAAVVFAASPAASLLTGSSLLLDAGWTAQ